MLRGLELLGSDQALRAAASVLTAPGPARAGALCRLKLFRRVAPGEEMATAFKSNVPDVQIDALRAARLVPPESLEPSGLPQDCSSDNADVRYAAVESGLSSADRSGLEDGDADGRAAHAGRRPYLKLLAIFGTADEQETVYAALRVPGAAGGGDLGARSHRERARRRRLRRRHAARGDSRARAARRTAGSPAPISSAIALNVKETPADAPAFEDDDLDANLVPPPEALWPLPDAEAVKKHWLAIDRSGPRACVTSAANRPPGTRC